MAQSCRVAYHGFRYPRFAAVRAAFASAGPQVVAVQVDADGMAVDAIPDGARPVCVTPSHQLPLGGTCHLNAAWPCGPGRSCGARSSLRLCDFVRTERE